MIFKGEIWKLPAVGWFNDIAIFFLFFLFLFFFFFFTSLPPRLLSGFVQIGTRSNRTAETNELDKSIGSPCDSLASLSRRNDDTCVSRRLPRRNDHEEGERVNDSPFLRRCSLPITVPVPLFPSAAWRNLWNGETAPCSSHARRASLLPVEWTGREERRQGRSEETEDGSDRKRRNLSLRRSFGSRLPTKLPSWTVFRSISRNVPLAREK